MGASKVSIPRIRSHSMLKTVRFVKQVSRDSLECSCYIFFMAGANWYATVVQAPRLPEQRAV